MTHRLIGWPIAAAAVAAVFSFGCADEAPTGAAQTYSPPRIFQTPDYVAVLYEYLHVMRVIYTDGSPHLEGAIDSFWMGDARGRWEDNTLVVDTIHFNDQTWFDKAGNFHSEALHVIERYTPMGPDHINYEKTSSCGMETR